MGLLTQTMMNGNPSIYLQIEARNILSARKLNVFSSYMDSKLKMLITKKLASVYIKLKNFCPDVVSSIKTIKDKLTSTYEILEDTIELPFDNFSNKIFDVGFGRINIFCKNCIEINSLIEQTKQIKNIDISIEWNIDNNKESDVNLTLKNILCSSISHISLTSNKNTNVVLIEHIFSSLVASGWKRYEIFSACINKKNSIYNLSHIKAQNILGIGNSAISFWNGWVYKNQKDGTIKLLYNPTEHNFIGNILLLNLRMIKGVCIEKFEYRFKKNPLCFECIQKALDFNLLKINRTHLKLTKKGMKFYDLINKWL